MKRVFLLTLLVLGCATVVHADVKLPKLVGDHMVLQQNTTVNVWGWADVGEQVTVTLGQATARTTTGEDGRWRARLETGKTDGRPMDLVVQGKNRIVLKDVLLGEVWVCSGQSNMVWSVSRSLNPQEEIAAAKYANIRLFQVKRNPSTELLYDVEGGWSPVTPETVKNFSGAGYFFGRMLHKQLNVPIGLIESDWGGTPSEAWTSPDTVGAEEAFKPILERWDDIIRKYPAALETYKARRKAWDEKKAQLMAEYKEKVEQAKKQGKRPPRRPRPPRGPNGPTSPRRPSNLYRGMIEPLTPMTVAGVIWYQGEANAGRAYQYREIFPLMIKDWRKQWGRYGQEKLPFYFVQLANFRPYKDTPGEDAWAELREAQLMTWQGVPDTGMAVAIDVGSATTIHPLDKQSVGKRLALAALATVYDKDIVYSGPVYKGMKVEGDSIRLSFDHVGGGLVAKDGKLTDFAIAGKDKTFVWAEARIDGDTVVVSSPKVKDPVAVRYAWQTNPKASLYNEAGLPATPFRTDQWKGMTADSK